MDVSTINNILCRRWFAVYLISLFLFYSSYINGEESTCHLQSTETCSNVIVVTIDEKSAKEETWFSLYNYPAGEKKVVALLHYDESYICNPTNGYKCTKTTDFTFNINVCKTLQNVELVGNGQHPVPCLPMENSPVESTTINKSIDSHNCSACANDAAPGNSVYHSRHKRCACPNGSPESNADNRERDDAGGKSGNREVNVHIGLITGIVVLILILSTIGVVVHYIIRNSIMSIIRKGYIQQYPHQGNEDLLRKEKSHYTTSRLV